ncbi:MAG: GGDEF domain-containing protein [Candidatus Colwellbacteria bacterium]|nr:GGDEF domain-containing protein [Candidatus Colwellbacteria bacterium]
MSVDSHSSETPEEKMERLETRILELELEVEEQKKLIAEYRALALQDPLLRDLYNRRGFEETLKEVETEDDRRDPEHTRKLAIIFIDVDNFKSINDTYGHQAGDRVLLALADIVVNEGRTDDTLVQLPEAIAGRLGGDEIAIALPGADEEGARKVLERIKRKVEALEIESEGEIIRFTISGGVGKGIDAADKGMYKDKRGDRAD